jgi:transposase
LFCRDLVASKKVRKGTVFVMYGAHFHLDINIVNYLRSLSAYVIFFPAYCPFYNPIEIMFSQVKSQLQKKYSEKPGDEKIAVLLTTDRIFGLSNVLLIYICR